jgi:hypothetical protein
MKGREARALSEQIAVSFKGKYYRASYACELGA